MFLGRQNELDFLNQRYESENGELLILYGRRRVGKTELLREFTQGKENVFYTCTECTDERQLHSFSDRLLSRNIPASKYLTEFTNWRQALESVRDMGGNGKKLLIIDEFPYMVNSNHSIPSILQELWDSGLKNERVMIVLCGSAMSFIEKEILAEKNPLYGRATGILKLLPLPFYDAARFFSGYSNTDKVIAYSVLGGIPYYLQQFNSKKSLAENITRHILTRGSILYSEVEFLMRQELRETAIYNTIIQAVALGNTRLNEIYNKTQIDKSKLSVYLNNLIGLGIIRREYSLSDGNAERANVQRGLYRVTDPFFRFWFAFVFPNISELESGDAAGIYRHVVEPYLEEFASVIFEDVCRQYLRRLNQKDELPFHFTRIGSWWNKTDEIDIMAADREGRNLILGECKFRKKAAFNFADMAHALSKYKSDKETVLTWFFFSQSGFTKEVWEAAKAEETGIRLVALADMI
jgi:AAA+ ATPase superfamily predicted ATPase